MKNKKINIPSKKIFLDTSFLLPFFIAGDNKHDYAYEAYQQFTKDKETVINTTVITELINLLGQCKKGGKFIDDIIVALFEDNTIIYLNKEDYIKSLDKFRFYGRKMNYSDCTILNTMENQKINEILTFDHDFENKEVKILNYFP